MFTIQLNSGVPIYRQVFDQVVREIDSGRLEKGDLLPSVRQMATDLGVNPMTVSKAWSLLETEGIVERKRGVGMVVLKKAEKPDDYVRPAIDRLVADARQVGMSQTQLIQLIKKEVEVMKRPQSGNSPASPVGSSPQSDTGVSFRARFNSLELSNLR